MKHYASIRLERAIGPVCPGNVMADAFVATDGYIIVRHDDTVTINHERAPAPIEVPWARVVSATCSPISEAPAFITSDEVVDGEAMLSAEAPRRGGWPKGKPRKPSAEGGEA